MTYAAIHQAVKASRGPASGHSCAHCGSRAAHWAYDHADPDRMVDDRRRVYSLDVAHYLPLCVQCHVRFDSPGFSAKLKALIRQPCPLCGAAAGKRCRSSSGKVYSGLGWQHKVRIRREVPWQEKEKT